MYQWLAMKMRLKPQSSWAIIGLCWLSQAFVVAIGLHWPAMAFVGLCYELEVKRSLPKAQTTLDTSFGPVFTFINPPISSKLIFPMYYRMKEPKYKNKTLVIKKHKVK